MLVLRMTDGAFDLSKGYLVQAKMNIGSSSMIAVEDPHRLSGQMDAMLEISSESHVWAYSHDGIAVARAGSFKAALSAGRQKEFETETFTAFLRAAFRTRTGDYKFDARSPGELAAMAEHYRARAYLLVSGQALS